MSNYPKKKSSIKCSLVSKQQMKELQNLTDQLHKSRIAVEHISKNRQEQNKSNYMVEQIKNDLKKCILMIKNQQTKHVVLKQLVALLNGQMSKIQTKEQELKEKQQMELERNIKQIRDDIDKIFEKKNHEVAKIAELKDRANQCRSQRVVFSNLFKKIQKELKQHEQVYKRQILKAQNNKTNLKQNSSEKNKSKMNHHTKPSQLSDISTINQRAHRRESSMMGNGQLRNKMQISAFPDAEFDDSKLQPQGLQKLNINISLVEEKRKKKQKNNNFLNLQDRPGQFQRSRTYKSTRIERMNSSKDLILNFEIVIDELTKFIDRIKSACGTTSVCEIMQIMQTVEEQNYKLQGDISIANQKIQEYNHLTELIISNQYRQNINEDCFDEFQENLAIESTMLGFKHLQEIRQKKNKRYQNLQLKSQHCYTQSSVKNYQQLNNICELLNISLDPESLESDQRDKCFSNQIKDFNSLQFQKKCFEVDQFIYEILKSGNQNSEIKHPQKNQKCSSFQLKIKQRNFRTGNKENDFSNKQSQIGRLKGHGTMKPAFYRKSIKQP